MTRTEALAPADEIANLADDLAEQLDQIRVTGRGQAKAIRIARRIQQRSGDVARKLETAS